MGRGTLGGPSISASALWQSAKAGLDQLLTDRERATLASISQVVRFGKNELIHREGEPATAVFNIAEGVVKTFTSAGSNGIEHINTFLFPGDLAGLAENGIYTASARALTPVTAYRLPVAALERQMNEDAEFDVHVICKLCHELRQAQRHAVILGRKQAVGRLALFLRMLAEHQQQGQIPSDPQEVSLSMSRSDIASYIGLSPAAISRGLRALSLGGIIALTGHRAARILDRRGLDAIADPAEA